MNTAHTLQHADFSAVADIVGPEIAAHMAKVAVELYSRAAAHAQSRGIILADTKFEFGMVPTSSLLSSSSVDRNLVERQPRFRNLQTGHEETMILVDEVLTPDSSRFWRADQHTPGQAQTSFDKQFVRDWLKAEGLLSLDASASEARDIRLPDHIVAATRERYQQAYEMITGAKFQPDQD